MIILRKIQAKKRTFAPPFFSYFSLSLNRKKTYGNESHEKETIETVSSSQIFFKIGVLKNFANFTGKHLWMESLFNTVAGLKACNFITKTLHSGAFLCEICEIFKSTFFYSTSPQVATFETKNIHTSAVDLLRIRIGNLDWNKSHDLLISLFK